MLLIIDRECQIGYFVVQQIILTDLDDYINSQPLELKMMEHLEYQSWCCASRGQTAYHINWRDQQLEYIISASSGSRQVSQVALMHLNPRRWPKATISILYSLGRVWKKLISVFA